MEGQTGQDPTDSRREGHGVGFCCNRRKKRTGETAKQDPAEVIYEGEADTDTGVHLAIYGDGW